MNESNVRAKNENFFHISEMLEGILSKYNGRLDSDMLKIWKVWETAVGAPIAKFAKPSGFKNSLLIVSVNSSAALQQLNFYKKDMIKNINGALGKSAVSEIKFKISD